jgi:hypothetical protein
MAIMASVCSVSMAENENNEESVAYGESVWHQKHLNNQRKAANRQ